MDGCFICVYGLYDIQDGLCRTERVVSSPRTVHFEQLAHKKHVGGSEFQLKAVSSCLDLRAALQPCQLNGQHPQTASTTTRISSMASIAPHPPPPPIALCNNAKTSRQTRCHRSDFLLMKVSARLGKRTRTPSPHLEWLTSPPKTETFCAGFWLALWPMLFILGPINYDPADLRCLASILHLLVVHHVCG